MSRSLIAGVYALVLASSLPAQDAERQRVLDASARSAWAYIQRNSFDATGLVRALDSWEYVTIWDIGSTLASYYSARGLGLISEQDYRSRMDRALATLAAMPLYRDSMFSRQYSARTAKMVDRDSKPSTTGYGWSAVDMGRFLAWLKIIERGDPPSAPVVKQIIARLNLERLVNDGLLQGTNTDPKYDSHFEYQEGRIGYEQYAAEALALWGVRAERALDFNAHGRPVQVLGETVLADARGDDLLTSEPFVMMGMELGWTPAWRQLSEAVLRAQERRSKRTGRVTMLSEDAIPVKPAYFYYYLLLHNGKTFVVSAPGGGVSASYPRWVSAKAAFGWHALLPSDFTWRAVETVQRAGASGRGWTAGVYERSRRATPSQNLNTAAVVLEAVYYMKRGCAFLKEC